MGSPCVPLAAGCPRRHAISALRAAAMRRLRSETRLLRSRRARPLKRLDRNFTGLRPYKLRLQAVTVALRRVKAP